MQKKPLCNQRGRSVHVAFLSTVVKCVNWGFSKYSKMFFKSKVEFNSSCISKHSGWKNVVRGIANILKFKKKLCNQSSVHVAFVSTVVGNVSS